METEDWPLSAEEDGGQECDSLMCIVSFSSDRMFWNYTDVVAAPIVGTSKQHTIDGEN